MNLKKKFIAQKKGKNDIYNFQGKNNKLFYWLKKKIIKKTVHVPFIGLTQKPVSKNSSMILSTPRVAFPHQVFESSERHSIFTLCSK